MPQALHVDQYSLTMGQFYWREGLNDRVSFELFVRSLPPQRGYLIAAGLGTALWSLRNLHYQREEIDYLQTRTKGLYDRDFLHYLHDLDLSLDVWAVPEGTPIFAQEPILRVTGPRIEATIVESLLLSIINHQTMIASKARRIVDAAGGRPVWDFSLRRLHGPEASLGVARAAYIAGCAGTATVEAGRILKIPTTGTMAHAQVMAFGPEREVEVFKKVLTQYPKKHALLVDTYNIQQGVMNAIKASKETGIPLLAIRVDSDLPEGAHKARSLLMGAGTFETTFRDVQILCSNDLDEYELAKLRTAPVNAYGIGTMLGTSADAPHLGGVYKLVEQHDGHRAGLPRYIMKLTPGKQTDPGSHQVWRSTNPRGDVIALADEPTPVSGANGLLRGVMASGRLVQSLPTLDETRAFCEESLDKLPSGVRRIEHPDEYPVHRSEKLWKLRATLGDNDAQQELYKREIDRGSQ